MKRYQVYLNPQSVDVLDDIADEVGVSRSQVVRDAVETIASRYERVVSVLHKSIAKEHPLLKLIGIVKEKNKLPRKAIKDHDTIYFID